MGYMEQEELFSFHILCEVKFNVCKLYIVLQESITYLLLPVSNKNSTL